MPQNIENFKSYPHFRQKKRTLKSPFEGINTALEYVYNDTVVLMYFTMFVRSGLGKTRVRLYGLDKNAKYIEKSSGKKYSGSYLMNVGLYFEDSKDFVSEILIFQKVK